MTDQVSQYPIAPPFELFFAPLEVMFDPNTLEQIRFAYFISKYGHAKQVRDSGGRFFDHPKGAAWIYIYELGGRDPRIINDLLLHDIQEDTYLLSSYRISLNFNKDVALDVRALTKLPKGKEALLQYLQRMVDRGREAITAKLCDRLHNVRTLDGWSPEKRKCYAEETQEHYLSVLIPALRAYGSQWAIDADKLEKKIKEALGPYLTEN